MSVGVMAPLVYWQVLVFAMGCCIGSFLNVVIYRLPQRLSLILPRSHCPQCKNSIPFYDNIPLLSYMWLRGRCRFCGVTIPARYPLVEAVAGLLALFVYRRYGVELQFFVDLAFCYALLVIFFIDLDTMMIPDSISIPGIVLGLVVSFLPSRLSWLDSLLGIVLGGGFFYLIAIGYQWLRGHEGLGGGDIKLLAMIGAFIGWPGVFFTILSASISGALIGLVLMRRSQQGMTTMLPFGPFLAFGATCYLFWGQAFFQWYWGNAMLPGT